MIWILVIYLTVFSPVYLEYVNTILCSLKLLCGLHSSSVSFTGCISGVWRPHGLVATLPDSIGLPGGCGSTVPSFLGEESRKREASWWRTVWSGSLVDLLSSGAALWGRRVAVGHRGPNPPLLGKLGASVGLWGLLWLLCKYKWCLLESWVWVRISESQQNIRNTGCNFDRIFQKWQFAVGFLLLSRKLFIESQMKMLPTWATFQPTLFFQEKNIF